MFYRLSDSGGWYLTYLDEIVWYMNKRAKHWSIEELVKELGQPSAGLTSNFAKDPKGLAIFVHPLKDLPEPNSNALGKWLRWDCFHSDDRVQSFLGLLHECLESVRDEDAKSKFDDILREVIQKTVQLDSALHCTALCSTDVESFEDRWLLFSPCKKHAFLARADE